MTDRVLFNPGAGAGAGPAIPACPPGWSRLLSSCYELSSTRSSWDYAKQDCATKGGHLLILNDRMEEVIVISLIHTL